VADRAGWRRAVEAELRELGRELDVPPAASVTAAVRQRLEAPEGRSSRVAGLGPGLHRHWRPVWRAALAVLAILVAVLVATPQGRAVITHVFRFAGIELHQGPGPVRTPGSSASLPGQQRMSLPQARRQVSFPILVPVVLGQPDDVVVSDGGRVASLVYHRTRYGQVRLDEFAGHLDPVYFEKFVHLGNVTEVDVNGAKGLWIKGPHELLYITRDGRPVAASARLTTGNTLIWGTRRVALRLEGGFGRKQALAVAGSAA
jgi:hypothetical protein